MYTFQLRYDPATKHYVVQIANDHNDTIVASFTAPAPIAAQAEAFAWAKENL